MLSFPSRRLRRDLITSLLLLSLAFRALIPAGFMPSSERPFSLEICRAGALAPIDLLYQHGHPDRPSHFEHCPFGSAPTGGPLAHVPTTPVAVLTALPADGDFVTLQLPLRAERAHQARAPPSAA